MTSLRPARRARGHRPEADPEVLRTDEVLDALARREPAPGGDAAVRLLRALTEDGDQRPSSVSITPST